MKTKYVAFDNKEFDSKRYCEIYEREHEYKYLFGNSTKNCINRLMPDIERGFSCLPQRFIKENDIILQEKPRDIFNFRDDILYFRYDVVYLLLKRIKELEEG